MIERAKHEGVCTCLRTRRARAQPGGSACRSWKGTWDTASGQGGALTLVLDAGRDGGVTGRVTVTGEGTYEAPLKDATVSKNELSARYDIPDEPNLEVTLNATLEGDAVAGTWAARQDRRHCTSTSSSSASLSSGKSPPLSSDAWPHLSRCYRCESSARRSMTRAPEARRTTRVPHQWRRTTATFLLILLPGSPGCRRIDHRRCRRTDFPRVSETSHTHSEGEGQ